MQPRLILASASEIRRQLLLNAGVPVDAMAARIDEPAIRAALDAEATTPTDVADALAEFKARKIAERHPDALVIGCDQVLETGGRVLGKPDSPGAAEAQLIQLSGTAHRLLSAVVVYESGKPVWRHVGKATLHMRSLSQPYVSGYVARNWDSIRHSVGCYKLEEEGARLFTRIDGDYFTVLGLPLLDLLSWLTLKGILAS